MRAKILSRKRHLIQKKQRHENVLRERMAVEAHARRLYENEGIIEMTPDGVWTYDERAKRISGYSAKIVAAALALAIALPGTADAAAKKRKKGPAAPPCVSESVMPTLAAYTLRSSLMTGALACGQESRDKYNQFVVFRESDITKVGNDLKRSLGSKTNHFVTEVANKAGGRLDCNEANSHFDAVLSPEKAPLESVVSQEWAQVRHGYQVCQAKTTKVAKKGRKK